jgi:predicted ATPase
LEKRTGPLRQYPAHDYAETCGGGSIDINGAIAHATNSGVELDLSELLRIKSQVLTAQNDRESIMNCLTEAIVVARAQSALAWELRSTMVLARLLCESGQRDQARHMLALMYDRFTEGFETADLKPARAPRRFPITILAVRHQADSRCTIL